MQILTNIPVDLGFKEVEFELELNFHAGRPSRIRFDQWDHPAEDAEVEIEKATCEGVDVTQLAIRILPDDFLIEICTQEIYERQCDAADYYYQSRKDAAA